MIRKKIFIFGIPGLAIILLLFTLKELSSRPKREVAMPQVAPPTTQLSERIAGIGVVEPKSEVIEVGTHLSGIIQAVFVSAGQKIKKNAPLFKIDDREAKAESERAMAQVSIAEVSLEDAKHQLAYYETIDDPRAISKEELTRRQFTVKKAETAFLEAKARLKEAEVKLQLHTVTAPIEGEVLKVNARAGEYAPTGQTSEQLVIMGDVSVLHVRVEIDESLAHRVNPKAKAFGSVRGRSDQEQPLSFVRIEPFLKSKKTLTGDSVERVDTRVLEVIYAFDQARFKAYPGQQVDVFISSQE